MYPSQSITPSSLQMQSQQLDNFFLKSNPEPNAESAKKSLFIGINYFSAFKGQKAIVTGASKGIGRFVAKALLDAGAYVACVSKNKQLLESLTKLYPNQAFAYAYDIADPDVLNICFKKIIEGFKGELDILIHCKGAYYNKSFDTTSLKDWDDCMNNNVRALVHFTSLCVPFLETSNGNKSVVILTSDAKDKPIQGEILYGVSQSMVNMFIQCLALDLAVNKIRVNGVATSAANTMFRVSKDAGVSEFENKIFLEGVADIKPLQYDQVNKLPHADEVASVVLWLASHEAAYITGEIVNIDDGMSLTSAYPKPRSQIM